MKNVTKLIFALLLSAVVMNLYATQAHADVNQNQTLDQTINCTTGSYGQNATCTATQNGTQNQTVTPNTNTTSQVVFRSDGTPIFVHVPVNTGTDPGTLVAGTITMITTAAGAIVTLKKKI